MRDIGDAGCRVLLLAGDRDGNEPAASLLERGAEVALRAIDSGDGHGMEAAAVGGSIDGEEGEAHDFTFSPAGS